VYEANPPATLDQSVILDRVYFHGIDEPFKAIVLTPACDFAQNKAEMTVACAVIEAQVLLSGYVTKRGRAFEGADGRRLKAAALSQNQAGNFKGYVKQLATQRIPRYHWLTPINDAGEPLIVDFQLITSLPTSEATMCPRLARVGSPYRYQLSARYTAYWARVGTPDFPGDDVQDWVDAAVEGVFG